jgi:hypothetical protein
LAVFEDRTILQVTKANGKGGKYGASNTNRARNSEHYTGEREKSQQEIIANVYVYVCHWETFASPECFESVT